MTTASLHRQRVRVVFLDAVGTLFDLPKGVGFHYADVGRRYGWDLSEEALNGAFRRAWKAAPIRPPGPRLDDDRSWWRALVFEVLDKCGVNPNPALREEYFSELYEHFAQPGVWALFPEVPEVLDRLEERFSLGIISNFDGRLRRLLAQFGLLDRFGHLIISSEVGLEKPDRAIFEFALERAGVAPSEALHVGDDPRLDWEGAAAAGMASFRLERPRNDLTGLLTYCDLLQT